MIIQELYKLFSKYKEEFEIGLIVGLLVGLGFGLFVGLYGGLFLGLGFGLFIGLGYLLSFFSFLGLASLITHFPNFIPLWLFIIIIILLIEIFFWLDKEKPKKKQNKFKFTLLKKGEALLESVVVLGYANLIRLTIIKLKLFKNWDAVLQWIGYIGAGLIALGLLIIIFYPWIKLNSLKYKK